MVNRPQTASITKYLVRATIVYILICADFRTFLLRHISTTHYAHFHRFVLRPRFGSPLLPDSRCLQSDHGETTATKQRAPGKTHVIEKCLRLSEATLASKTSQTFFCEFTVFSDGVRFSRTVNQLPDSKSV